VAIILSSCSSREHPFTPYLRRYIGQFGCRYHHFNAFYLKAGVKVSYCRSHLGGPSKAQLQQALIIAAATGSDWTAQPLALL